MSATATHRVELPAGYTVVDRLGAGGYGEVWKATAPGGLEKAVKIVFGHCDEGMAERELKSLERIKSVRHPFLLSIERYEIVNNRLVIVTELADMSLSDCFEKHIAAGRPGIPRDQLIAYMWDTAEALDCLLEQHSLQHLDIKPENLLVVGDHIKVADFGLVKELASKTLNSVMGGMTPLYAAPEIYDNNPSRMSDQYSLAIVYQHMLTGTLPFSGRTPAQLAKQHTLAQPNVNPLSEADRIVVRKALEKDPRARFATCREFVAALRSAGQTGSVNIATPSASTSTPSKSPASDDTKSISLVDTRHLSDPICFAATQVLSEVQSASEELAKLRPERPSRPVVVAEFPVVDPQIVDVEVPPWEQAEATPLPTLCVGIGGTGIKLLKAIRSRLNAHDPQGQLALAWLAIDTDRETLKETYDAEDEASLSAADKLHVPLRRPNQYRDDSQALLQWVSRRWLYNIPRSLQTRGFRPLGRIAIVDHAAEVLTALQKRLHWLAAHLQGTEDDRPAIRVVVLAGMSGGTGSGTAIDIAQAVRSICHENQQPVKVQGIFGCTYHSQCNESLAAANMYALLTELGHAQSEGNSGDNPPPGPASRYESSEPPFDEIYAVPLAHRMGRPDGDPFLRSVGDYLLMNVSGSIRPAVDAIHSATSGGGGSGDLRTFSCVDIAQLAGQRSTQLRQGLLRALVDYWRQQGAATVDPDARHFHQEENSQFAQAVLARLPQVTLAPGEREGEAGFGELRSKRSAKIKLLATAFLRFLDNVQPQIDGDQPPMDVAAVIPTATHIVERLCQQFEHGNPTEEELTRSLFDLVRDRLTELAATCVRPDDTELAEGALALFATGPLECGYERRTILVSPHEQCDPALMQAIRDRCPTLANYPTAANGTYLIREGSGLNPLHLGARLAELYPDIAEAGSRLHSRDDIRWQDLRTRYSQDPVRVDS